MKKLLLVIALVLSLSMIGCNSSQIKDGIYIGEGQGKGGTIKVELTIKNKELSGIKVLENNETPGYADAMDTMTKQMISQNTIEADMVSGATLTSTGFKNAIQDAFKKSGGKASQLKSKNSKVTLEPREEQYVTDVIVIGAGGAGLSAAIEAANQGVKVLVIEKMAIPGGNTLISGAEMAASQNWIQDVEGIEDNNDSHYNDTLKGGDYENDPELVRVLADNALEGAKWLKDEVGVVFEDYMLFFGGHSVKRSLVPLNASGVELIAKLVKKVGDLNVPIHLNTDAAQLIIEDGKVTGVIADYGSQKITYKANKGVVIATGGFGSNMEMRKQYNSEMDERILSTNTVGSTGDGVILAEQANANIVDMEYIQTYPTCDPETGTLLYVGDVRMEGLAILVNKEGKRFVEELERRDIISKATVEQTGGVSYLFFDQAAMDASKVNVKHETEYNELIKSGVLVKADTIEQAAKHFGIDAKELKATIEKYNQYAEQGKDLDFNKRGKLVAFGEGPYYIMKSKPAVHHTMGGIKINTNAQVLNEDGSIIKGLYAAGEVTGDIHGTNRLGSNAIADIIVFGRIAGKQVASEQ